MKFLFSLLIVLALFSAGCRKKVDNPSGQQPQNVVALDSADVKTSPVSGQANEAKLMYAPQKGSEFVYVLTAMGKDYSTLKADTVMENKVESKMTYKFSVAVTDVETDGALTMNVTFLAVTLDAGSTQEKVHYQSSEKHDSATIQKFFQYEALVNNTFGLRVKNDGEILEVFKSDKIIDKMVQLSKMPKAPSPQEKAQIKSQVEQSVLLPTVQQIFRKLPANTVAVNHTWNLNFDLPINQIISFNTNQIFKFKGIEMLNDNKVARIDIGAEAKPEVNPKAKEQGIEVETATMNGKGTAFFDLTANMMSYGKTKLSIHSIIKAKNKGPKGIVSISQSTVSEKVNIFRLVEVKNK